MDAAKRELYEESGVTDAEIIPVCDYNAWCKAGDANGVVFAAVVKVPGELPESEMAEVKFFDKLPEELTYPLVTPVLFEETSRTARKFYYLKQL